MPGDAVFPNATEQSDLTAQYTASEVIAAFGGIRPMAKKLAIPVTTVQGWKKRNRLPENRIGEILSVAHNAHIDLSSLSASTPPASAMAIPAAPPASHKASGTPTKPRQTSKPTVDSPMAAKKRASKNISSPTKSAATKSVITQYDGRASAGSTEGSGDLLKTILAAALTALVICLLWWLMLGRGNADQATESAADITNLKAEVARLRAEVAKPAAEIPPAVDLTPIEARLSAVEAAWVEGDTQLAAQVDEKITLLNEAVVSTPVQAPPPAQGLDEAAVTALLGAALTQVGLETDTKITSLSAELRSETDSKISTSLNTALAPVTEQLTTTTSAFAGLKDEIAATLDAAQTDMGATVAAMETRLDANLRTAITEDVTASFASSAKQLASVQQLSAALRSGEDLPEAINALRVSAPDDAALADVVSLLDKRVAEFGLPEQQAILSQFDAAAQPLLNRDRPVTSESAGLGGIGARLGAALDIGPKTARDAASLATGSLAPLLTPIRNALANDDKAALVTSYQALDSELQGIFGPVVGSALARTDAAEAQSKLTNWLAAN